MFCIFEIAIVSVLCLSWSLLLFPSHRIFIRFHLNCFYFDEFVETFVTYLFNLLKSVFCPFFLYEPTLLAMCSDEIGFVCFCLQVQAADSMLKLVYELKQFAVFHCNELTIIVNVHYNETLTMSSVYQLRRQCPLCLQSPRRQCPFLLERINRITGGTNSHI